MAATSRRLSSLLSRSPFFPCVYSNVQDKDQVFCPGQTISNICIVVSKFLLFGSRDIDEVIQRANRTRYGLAAGLFTRNTDTTEFSCILSEIKKHRVGVNWHLEEKGVLKNVPQIVAYSPMENFEFPKLPTVVPSVAGITAAHFGLAFATSVTIFTPSLSWVLLGIPVVTASTLYLLASLNYVLTRLCVYARDPDYARNEDWVFPTVIPSVGMTVAVLGVAVVAAVSIYAPAPFLVFLGIPALYASLMSSLASTKYLLIR